MLRFLKCYFLFIFLMAGCDWDEELSGNYFYMGEGGDLNQIISHAPNRKDIYGEIIDYAYNDDYIIATQRPSPNAYRAMITFYIQDTVPRYNDDSIIDKIEEMKIERRKAVDNILRTDPYYQKIFSAKLNYWIIDHKMDSVIGPLDKKEYTWARKRLHIPDNVKIDDHIEIDWYYTDKKR